MLSEIVINYLQLDGFASMEIINDSPDLIPPKAKLIYIEPLDELFSKVEDPQKSLEKCLEDSYILGQNYIIEIAINDAMSKIKIAKIIDVNGKEVKFANINNIDLNVEFLPLKQTRFDESESILQNSCPPRVDLSDGQTNQISQKKKNNCQLPLECQSKYDPQKKWVPFCGSGYILSTGERIIGEEQPDLFKI